MDWHKYQKLLYWKDFVMNCFCFQIICDHLIVMRYFVMGDHVMAINVPLTANLEYLRWDSTIYVCRHTLSSPMYSRIVVSHVQYLNKFSVHSYYVSVAHRQIWKHTTEPTHPIQTLYRCWWQQQRLM